MIVNSSYPAPVVSDVMRAMTDDECPSWCERALDHGDDPPFTGRSHIGVIASVGLQRSAGGPLRVYVYRRGATGPEVIVARGLANGDEPFEGRWHSAPVTDDQAGRLAGRIELLAGATADEHQAQCAAIRAAATGAEDGLADLIGLLGAATADEHRAVSGAIRLAAATLAAEELTPPAL